MNNSQRKYLIDKLTANSKTLISALKEGRQEMPSLSNYTYLAIMNGTLKIRSSKAILEALRQMALNAKEGENWLGGDRYSRSDDIKMRPKDLFDEPDGYREEAARVKAHNAEIDKKIAAIHNQVEGLELRITLASDKTLQRMINEVDDMGDLSLVDSKIRLLSA